MRVGFLPGLQFVGPLPLLQRDLSQHFAEQTTGALLEGNHLREELKNITSLAAARVGLVRGGNRGGRDIQLGKDRRHVVHGCAHRGKMGNSADPLEG